MVSTSRCGRDNPGSNPGYSKFFCVSPPKSGEEDEQGECEQCEHPKQSRKQRSHSQRESEKSDAHFRSKMVEVKRAASCTRIQETPEENAMAFLEPDEIARIQTFLRSQAGAKMPSAKGAALASKQSSTTSGKFSGFFN